MGGRPVYFLLKYKFMKYFWRTPGTVPSKRPDFREILMREVHDNPLSIHLGRDRMVAELERRVHWPRMRQHVSDWIQACVPCQRNKIDRRKPHGLLRQLEIPTGPGTHYSIDLITHLPRSGPHEYTAIFVICDRFSKRIWLIPTWDTCTGPMLAELFTRHIIHENGAPVEIVSDRDVRFAHGKGFWQTGFPYKPWNLSKAVQQQTSTYKRKCRACDSLHYGMYENVDLVQTRQLEQPLTESSIQH